MTKPNGRAAVREHADRLINAYGVTRAGMMAMDYMDSAGENIDITAVKYWRQVADMIIHYAHTGELPHD